MRPILAYESDEVGRLATLSASVSMDAENPLANLQTRDPMEIASTAAVIPAGLTLLWAHPGAVDVQVASLHQYNIPAGTVLHLQRNHTNAWGAPAIDIAVTVPPYAREGTPFPIGVDLTKADGYDEDGFEWTRWVIPALSQSVGIGSALLWGTKRTGLLDVLMALVPLEQDPVRIWSTAYGRRNKYRVGTWRRALGGVIPMGAAEYAEYLAWFRAVGGAFAPFLFWMDPDHASDAWIADFQSDTTEVSLNGQTIYLVHVVIQELSPGLAVPTLETT